MSKAFSTYIGMDLLLNSMFCMKEDNVIQKKTFQFAIRIVNAYKYLVKEKHEYVLSKQLLRSGTSIGANIEEGIGAQSRADFISKLSISYKEARETYYWLRLLLGTGYLNNEMAASLMDDITEICKILARIKISMKSA
ncbi:MAG: four helix bundle protein [Daejeonella sp.]